MKKYIIYLLATVAVTSSCTDLLDVDPLDFTAPQTFYSSEKELKSALAAVYNPMVQQYGNNIPVYFCMGSDEGFSKESSPVSRPDYYNFDAANTCIEAVWTGLYKGIDRASVLIENADRADCDPSAITRAKGEALFLRAYYHFLLTAYWGDVPMKLESTKSAMEGSTPRIPAAEIYAQTVRDMEEAIDMVDDIETVKFGGEVNKAAVRGILARVCLHAAGRTGNPAYYSKAREHALFLMEEAQNTGKYALNPDYRNIFIKLMQDKYDIRESLFEVEFWGNADNVNSARQLNGFVSYFGTIFNSTYEGDANTSMARTRGYYYATPLFFDSFEEGDLRREWNTLDYSFRSYTTLTHVAVDPLCKFRFIGKYRREYEVNFPIYTWGNSTNLPLLRYADVLLMFAEADNEVNSGTTPESLDAVNQVRRRAFGLPVNTPSAIDTVAMNHDDFLKYIQDERFRELAFETHRKLDLWRWGIFMDRMHEVRDTIQAFQELPTASADRKKSPPYTDTPGWPGLDIVVRPYTNVAEKHLLMPIPEKELSVNTAIKANNPGW
jgi:hypothetical protein